MDTFKNLLGVVLMAIFFISCGNKAENDASKNNEVDIDKKEKTALSLKVMTYNIHHANPPSEEDKIDIAAIINVIEAENPDLVALQEVDYNTDRSGRGNQAELIADQLGMEYYFAKALDYDNGQYGNAILSKYPIENPKTLKLPNEPEDDTEDRVLAMGLISITEDVEIFFGSTHLDYKKDSKSRILQVKELIEISKDRNSPMILGGDFNDSTHSETIRLLDSEFIRTCERCPPTIPVNNPQRAIDFIFYKHPDSKFDLKSHKVISETYASDHRPVFAEIVLEK